MQNAIKAEHNEKIYYFCSEICRQKFLSNPDSYISVENTLPISGIINQGKTDRNIRLISGAVFIALALKTTGSLKAVFSILGFIAALTSITGFCFLYELFNINTSDHKPAGEEMIRKKRETYRIIKFILISIFLLVALLIPDKPGAFFLLLSLLGIYSYKERIKNIGIADRTIRFIFGAIFIIPAYQSDSLWTTISMIPAIFCIVTAVTKFSLLYELLNIKTGGHIPHEETPQATTVHNKDNSIRIICFILGFIALSLATVVGGIPKLTLRFLGMLGIIAAFTESLYSKNYSKNSL